MTLGLNIDHIATLREARKVNDPDILEALYVAKNSGVGLITLHLREDERHINKTDLLNVLKISPLPVNVESSVNKSILEATLPLNPFKITLVPENRSEITTEGGLNLELESTKAGIKSVLESGINLSLFVEPRVDAIERAHSLGAKEVELHTGKFSNIFSMLYSNLPHTPHSIKNLSLPKNSLESMLQDELSCIKTSAKRAHELGLRVCAGHGLNSKNLPLIVKISEIEEVNIGHSIISRAVFVGLSGAIAEILNSLK